jgi:pimeloyl-ACP methyl ester carboxylesterase
MIRLFSCLVLVACGESAHAALNDWSCVPGAAHPHPVVLVHGQGGHYTDLSTITNAVVADGHACVFGFDYGLDAAGIPGRAHLNPSAAELAAFVHKVLAATGKPKVDLITYSEGGMVADNFILTRGGEKLVHRVAGLAPGHHPYAHVGAPGLLDNDLFLPNMVKDSQKVDPALTEPQVVDTAFSVYQIFRAPDGVIDWDLVTSDFVADLFDPGYWVALQGGLSEPDWVFIRLKTAGRTLPTRDSAPDVCYANFVSLAGDLLVGSSAGFQDPAPNVDNVAVPTYADHGEIIRDALVVAEAVASLDAPCALKPSGPATSGFVSPFAVASASRADDPPASHDGASPQNPGCSMSPGGRGAIEAAVGWLLLVFAVLIHSRRRTG